MAAVGYKRGKKVTLILMNNTIKHKYVIFFLFFLASFIYALISNCSYLTHGIASLMDHSFPGVIYFVDTDKKMVALTVDDGPDSLTTLKILDVLDKYDSKATFFIISNYALKNKDIMIEIVGREHELGNHMTHDEPSTGLSFAEFKAKFDEADSVLSTFTEICWFRPGSGKYNSKIIDYISNYKHKYLCALGSVYPMDAHIPSSTFASNYIQFNVKKGSIIILHDREKRGKRTAKTLESILPALKQSGYQIVTLSELYSARKLNDADK